MIQLVLGAFFRIRISWHTSNVLSAYIVQGHRFDIIERYGCHPNVYNTLLAYFLVSMWPLLLGLISAAYCSTSCTRP